jgi:hypothetical protein
VTTNEHTRVALEDELTATEVEISRLRIVRDRTSHKLEQTLRKRERLYRHLAALEREDEPEPEEAA